MKAFRLVLLFCAVAGCATPTLASDADLALNRNYRALIEQLDQGN